jgi:hypothetical protein
MSGMPIDQAIDKYTAGRLSPEVAPPPRPAVDPVIEIVGEILGDAAQRLYEIRIALQPPLRSVK